MDASFNTSTNANNQESQTPSNIMAYTLFGGAIILNIVLFIIFLFYKRKDSQKEDRQNLI